MEPDALTRFYAEVAKNLSRSWLEAGSTVFAANRHLTDAVRGWGDEAWAAAEVLTRATRRSGEETRDVFGIAEGAPDAASLARFGDLVRAQTFLWTAANLSAAERLGRAASARGETLPGFAPDFSEPVASASSPRVFVLGVVAMDLWIGYAGLQERARWTPDLVRDEDWELQHRRGAGRVLDAAAALGGTLIKAAQFASSRPDLLPAPYIESLSELQDRVPPQPWSVMEGAVEREIGRPIREAFEEFEGEPVASASIAQVHRARLSDGRRVAVKAQYPRIAQLMEADLAALEGIFDADPHPGNLFVQPGPNGPVLVLLDHGLTVSVPPELVVAMKEAIEALSEGDFDALAGALQKTGLDLDPDLDLDTLLGLVGVLLGGDRGEEGDGGGTDLGEFGLSLGASIGHIPNDLLLVGRAIGLIDGITRQLDPDLDTINIVARYAQEA